MTTSRAVTFVVPGRLDTLTGGSIYNRRMVDALRGRGWTVEILELDAGFPFPTASALAHAATSLGRVRDDAIVVVDGLALGVMPDIVEREAARLRFVALVHLPFAADVGLAPEAASHLAALERRALRVVRLVIVTGSSAMPMLAGYALRRDSVVVVEPGTDRTALSRGSGGAPVQLLCAATLNPIKGHEILLRALASVRDHRWHLTCAGNDTRSPHTAAHVRATVRSLGLQDRVSLVGELDSTALNDAYDRADVFVLASLQETYGMSVAEALGHGLPVVGTATGAIPDLVGSDAGLLAPPGNTAALAEALARVVGDAALRARLAEGARRVRDRLPTWQHAAEQMATALERLHTMDHTLSEWLRLREPADFAARSVALTRTIAVAMTAGIANEPVRVLDLASGTGSNLRYLVSRLPGPQDWVLTDQSRVLLDLVTTRTSEWAATGGFAIERTANGCVIRGQAVDCHVATRQVNLRELDDLDLFSGRHLVTASALLDLVSEEWLRVLAARCRAAGAIALFTITYDGRSSCTPVEPEDDMIRNLLNQHQKTDKGLGGPAAGPDAAECAARCFAEAGYRVAVQRSDWALGAVEAELQRRLIVEWAEAATELAPEDTATIASWRTRRLQHVDAGRSHIVVGHHDLAAW